MFKQMICLKDIASIYGNKVSFISDIIKMRQSQKINSDFFAKIFRPCSNKKIYTSNFCTINLNWFTMYFRSWRKVLKNILEKMVASISDLSFWYFSCRWFVLSTCWPIFVTEIVLLPVDKDWMGWTVVALVKEAGIPAQFTCITQEWKSHSWN